MISELFKQAELSLAAYATLAAGDITPAPLKEAGMTATQAQHFAEHWRVVDQSSHPTNGFSATVFEEVSTGKRYLAIRGTNDGMDLVTDAIDIAILPSMSAQYDSLRHAVQTWLGNGTLSPTFTVTGHSLGGYLATGLAAEFSLNITLAYLYNAPGLYGVLGGAIGPLLSAFGLNFPLDAAKIFNIKAAAGISPIAGLGTQVSTPIWVQIENQLDLSLTERPVALNHSQQSLTDALAIYSVFATVDQSVSIDTVGNILKAISNTNANTLEAALNRLGKLFGKNYPDTQTTRDILYTNLYDLQVAVTSGTVVPLAGASRDTLVTEAKRNDATGLAYRYALKELNPFAIVGADYGPHNVNGELDLYDPADGSGNLTDLYLADRAAFLSWKNLANKQDKTTILGPKGPDNWEFTDVGSGYTVNVKGDVLGFPSGDPVTHKSLFGSDTLGDALVGSAKADNLFGQGGNDTLSGGYGNDYLEGQLGNDALFGEALNDALFKSDENFLRKAA